MRDSVQEADQRGLPYLDKCALNRPPRVPSWFNEDGNNIPLSGSMVESLRDLVRSLRTCPSRNRLQIARMSSIKLIASALVRMASPMRTLVRKGKSVLQEVIGPCCIDSGKWDWTSPEPFDFR